LSTTKNNVKKYINLKWLVTSRIYVIAFSLAIIGDKSNIKIETATLKSLHLQCL